MLKSFETLINAIVYYISAAISAVVSNKVVLLVTVFLIMTAGKSFSLGKNLVKARG